MASDDIQDQEERRAKQRTHILRVLDQVAGVHPRAQAPSAPSSTTHAALSTPAEPVHLSKSERRARRERGE